MNIDDILAKESKAHYKHDDINYMTGGISSDSDPNYFRFYRDPVNTKSYMVILKSDIIGDIEELTEAERIFEGHLRANIYRIGLRDGTLVKMVSITFGKLGETIAAFDKNKMKPSSTQKLWPGRPTTQTPKQHCHYNSSCWTNCCTHSDNAHSGMCTCDYCCIA